MLARIQIWVFINLKKRCSIASTSLWKISGFVVQDRQRFFRNLFKGFLALLVSASADRFAGSHLLLRDQRTNLARSPSAHEELVMFA